MWERILLYSVWGTSMAPSLHSGDRLLMSRRAYRRALPGRGDVVVVRDPRDPSEHYLKRVVGMPSEEVRLAEGMLFIDGRQLAEPYLGGLPASPGLSEAGWTLGEDQYFVMGDNRAHSTDSREFGPIALPDIIGKVRFRWWPLARWGRVL